MRLFWMQYSRRILTLGSIIFIMLVTGFGVWFLNGSSGTINADDARVHYSEASATADIAWNSVTISQRESEIAAALQCVRVDDALPLEINPTLDAEAHRMIDSLATVTNTDQLFVSYDWVLVAPMWFEDISPSGCGWSDFNPVTMDIDRIQHIGIALKPPVGYTPASVLILGKEAP